MKNSVFITGTDTGIGKTTVTVALLRQLNSLGYKTFGLKPIATGCYYNRAGELVNEDALALQEASSVKRNYKVINPISFQEPIAPHIAAKKKGDLLTVNSLVNIINESIQTEAFINIIEGVGGWSVPINEMECMSDVVRTLQLPVILVVGIRLGCINHAILTAQNMMYTKIPLIGWVANCIDDTMLEKDENIATLARWMPVPCLGSLAHAKQPNFLSELKIDLLLS